MVDRHTLRPTGGPGREDHVGLGLRNDAAVTGERQDGGVSGCDVHVHQTIDPIGCRPLNHNDAHRCVAEQGLQAGRRLCHVDWDVRGAKHPHGPNGNDEVDGARKDDADPVPGFDTDRSKPTTKIGGPLVELSVCQLIRARANNDCVRVRGRSVIDECRNQRFDGDRVSDDVFRVFCRSLRSDGRSGTLHQSGDPVGKRREHHRCGVTADGRSPVLTPELHQLAADLHEEGQIIHRRPGRKDRVMCGRSIELCGRKVFECEHDTRARLRDSPPPCRGDDLGERHRSILEHASKLSARLFRQRTERLLRLRSLHERQRVEEVTNDVGHGRVVADRSRDSDLEAVSVVPRAQRCGQRRKCRGERCCSSGTAQSGGCHGRNHVHISVGLSCRGHDAKCSEFGVSRLQPQVVHRRLVLPLPFAVLGVGHRQRGKPLASVGGVDLLPHDVERTGVTDDVVGSQQHGVEVGVGIPGRGQMVHGDQWSVHEVEALLVELCGEPLERGVLARRLGDPDRRIDVENAAMRTVRRVQRGLMRHHRTHRRIEADSVVALGQVVQTGDVVPKIGRVSAPLVEHGFFASRHRPLPVEVGHCHHVMFGVGSAPESFHRNSEFGNGPMGEGERLVHLHAAAVAHTNNHFQCVQRGAAKREEVVGGSHRRQTQDVRPNRRNLLFRRCLWEPPGRSCGQRAPRRRSRQRRCINLAVHSQWDVVDHLDGLRVRVSRQQRGQFLADGVEVEFGIVGGLHPQREDLGLSGLVPNGRQHVGDRRHLRLIHWIVEFEHRFGSRLVPKANIPAVRQCVVVVRLLDLVHVDSGGIDEAVGRSTAVFRTLPCAGRFEDPIHLGQLDVDVPIEVDERHAIEDRAVLEKGHVHVFGHGVGGAVVDAPRLGDRSVDGVWIETVFTKQTWHQAGFKELTARETGHDRRNSQSFGPFEGDRVDRLVAAVADIREPLEAVPKDLVHCVDGHELVIHSQRG